MAGKRKFTTRPPADLGARVAILVPSYGHLDYALEAARSALVNTPEALALVIDDGSPGFDAGPFQELGPRVLLHRFPSNGGLTRSWNHGLCWARDLGCTFAVAGNSDVLYPAGWWPPVEASLGQGPQDPGVLHLAGPVTNAPGHRRFQDVRLWLDGYQVADDRPYLDSVQRSLAASYAGQVALGPVNGYCLAARVDTWFLFAHGSRTPFNRKLRMTRQEDDLCARWGKRGLQVGCVPGSFVFHYRGVSRRHATRGNEGRGWFRPTGGTPA